MEGKKKGNKTGLFVGLLAGIGCLPIILMFLFVLMLGAFFIISEDEVSGNSFGSMCRQDGEIEMNSFSSTLTTAGVFAGMEYDFIRIAEEYGIDPVLMAAIALHETGYGTSNAVVNKNNPGGLMNPATGSRELYEFATLEDGMRAMANTLHNRIIKDGLNTIEKLGNVYAPVGAANDPNGLNIHWIPNITQVANSLGGLTMNCEMMMLGNEQYQIIYEEMLKYQGWSYVWAGAHPSVGFDCSGIMQWAYAKAGIQLPRTSYQQYLHATPVSKEELQPGDLIFFLTDNYAPVTHVGMYVGNGQMYDSNHGGIGFSNAFDSYWGPKIVGYGRVANFSN